MPLNLQFLHNASCVLHSLRKKLHSWSILAILRKEMKDLSFKPRQAFLCHVSLCLCFYLHYKKAIKSKALFHCETKRVFTKAIFNVNLGLCLSCATWCLKICFFPCPSSRNSLVISMWLVCFYSFQDKELSPVLECFIACLPEHEEPIGFRTRKRR